MGTLFRLSFFAVLIGVGLAYGDVAFFRGAGLYFVIIGLGMAWTKRVPVGARGAPPSSYILGFPAVLCSLGVAGMGIGIAVYAREIACFLSGTRCA